MIEKKVTQTKLVRRRTENGRPVKAQELSRTRVANALRKNHGVVAKAAEELGCSPPNVWYRIDNDEELKRIYEAAKSEVLDMAEHGLITDVLDRSNEETSGLEERKFRFQQTKYYLDRQGKNRGYGEQGAKGGGTSPTQININIVPATGKQEKKEVKAEVEFEEANYEEVEA